MQGPNAARLVCGRKAGCSGSPHGMGFSEAPAHRRSGLQSPPMDCALELTPGSESGPWRG